MIDIPTQRGFLNRLACNLYSAHLRTLAVVLGLGLRTTWKFDIKFMQRLNILAFVYAIDSTAKFELTVTFNFVSIFATM